MDVCLKDVFIHDMAHIIYSVDYFRIKSTYSLRILVLSMELDFFTL